MGRDYQRLVGPRLGGGMIMKKTYKILLSAFLPLVLASSMILSIRYGIIVFWAVVVTILLFLLGCLVYVLIDSVGE